MTGIVVPTAAEFYATRTFDEPPIPLSYLVKKSQTAMVPTLRAFLASWATPWLTCTHDETMWTPKTTAPPLPRPRRLSVGWAY